MDRDKRQSKPPEPYIVPAICYPRIRKKKPKKKAPEKAQYQVIPYPLKFIYTQKIFCLYAGIGLREHQGTLYSESSVLNEYLMYTGVEVQAEKEYKRFSVNFERKEEFKLPPWQYQVEKLMESHSSELRGWGERIKNFSLKHEDLFRALNNGEKTFGGYKEDEIACLTQESDRKIGAMFEKLPCLMFTSTVKKGESFIKRIDFNDRYINEIGYSVDSMATTLLQEGMPRIMPNDTACPAKLLVDGFYNAGGIGCETPEIISELPMKNGFTKKVRYKMYYMGAYRGDSYELHGLVVILGKEEDTHKELATEYLLNKKFLKKMISKEKETNKFLNKYYSTSINLPYTSINKTCQIRELFVNKEETEDDRDLF